MLLDKLPGVEYEEGLYKIPVQEGVIYITPSTFEYLTTIFKYFPETQIPVSGTLFIRDEEVYKREKALLKLIILEKLKNSSEPGEKIEEKAREILKRITDDGERSIRAQFLIQYLPDEQGNWMLWDYII